jgi:hypothetical protein
MESTQSVLKQDGNFIRTIGTVVGMFNSKS